MNTKKFGILVIGTLLSVSGFAMANDTIDYNSNTNIILEKVKANKETITKAQEAMQNKDFQTAIELLTAYINEKPKKYEVYKLRGDAYYALRRYDLAQKDYQAAIDIKANSDKLMTNTKYVSAIVLGADKKEQLQNVELGDLYGALMYAQKAQNDLAYTASYENAQKYNSHIYLPQPNKNDINKINCPQKYGKIVNPQGIDISIYGAINDIETGNYNEAIYKLQSVTNEYPNYYLGHYLTGVALSELEKDDDAIKSFERAIILNPYDFESYASLGRIYYSKAETTFSEADSKKSTEYFNKAIQLNKNCPTYYFYIGMNELQVGNTNVAIHNFDKALQINQSDYNSMYYKLIAQYMNGNYNDVVDGATKLLYRHVSNYNSVLYLRALAYTKLNNSEKALQDLDSAENNIEDIYNVDIKQISTREKSLESYIHYLKSEIQHSKGIGAASDNSTAYSNPIINRLANAKKAIAPYEKSLEGETISLEDYNKFESFYSTSLPKLLESGAIITYEDIDNQYDYIRTTFSDIGVSFIYLNPDYKMTTIKDYPYKKYSSKLSPSEQDSLSARPASEIENVQLARTQHDALRQSTPRSELLVQSGQTSLAQLLASNDLIMKSKNSKPMPADHLKSIKESSTASNTQFKPETPAAESLNTTKNIASGDIYTGDKSLVDNQNNTNVRNILDTEEKMANNVPQLRLQNITQTPQDEPSSTTSTENVKVSTDNLHDDVEKETIEQLKAQQKTETQEQKEAQKQVLAQDKTTKDQKTAKKILKSQSDTSIEQPKIKNNLIAMDTPTSITEKHASLDKVSYPSDKSSATNTSENTEDVVILDTGNKETIIVPDSDLFTKDTKFTKPQNELTVIPSINTDKPEDKQITEKIVEDKVKMDDTHATASETIIQEQKIIVEPISEVRTEKESRANESFKKTEENIKSVENDKIYIEKQLSDFINISMPEKFFDSEKQDETITSPVTQIKEDEVNKTLKSSQDKNLQKKNDEVESKASKDDDEAKIQRLKARLSDMHTLSDEEKKAQKKQLKAERAAAKAKYKAIKAAKRATKNNK